MKKYLFLLIGLFLLIPSAVNAKEYTFNIGNNSEYSESNFDELDNKIDMLIESDLEDEIIDNVYILKFDDGNYDFSDSRNILNDSWGGMYKYYFGTGTYEFSYFSIEGGYLEIHGNGANNTNIIFPGTLMEAGYFKANSVNLSINGDFNFELQGDSSCSELYANKFFPGIEFENTIINILSETGWHYFCYVPDDVLPLFVLDNVTINSNSKRFTFEFSNNNYTSSLNEANSPRIINSDLSKINAIFEGYGRGNKNMNVQINNTKLNKVYALKTDVDIDCDCVFNSEIKKNSGTSNIDTFIEQNEYNLYEYYDDNSENNAKIAMETCKDKSFKINKRLSLSEIKDEFGYDIDDTWTFNPEGIIELKDNALVPLKVGKTRLSKEIDGEVKTLRLEVTDIDKKNNKAIDKSTKNIVNPKTVGSVFVILILLLLVIPATILVKKRSVN